VSYLRSKEAGWSTEQLPSDQDARAHAKRVIRELKEAGGFDDPALKMSVKDEMGNTVCLCPF